MIVPEHHDTTFKAVPPGIIVHEMVGVLRGIFLHVEVDGRFQFVFSHISDNNNAFISDYTSFKRS